MLDAFQCANRQILFSVWHGNAPFYLWMPKLSMRANFGNLVPAVLFEYLNAFPAVNNVYEYTSKKAYQYT